MRQPCSGRLGAVALARQRGESLSHLHRSLRPGSRLPHSLPRRMPPADFADAALPAALRGRARSSAPWTDVGGTPRHRDGRRPPRVAPRAAVDGRGRATAPCPAGHYIPVPPTALGTYEETQFTEPVSRDQRPPRVHSLAGPSHTQAEAHASHLTRRASALPGHPAVVDACRAVPCDVDASGLRPGAPPRIPTACNSSPVVQL